LVFQTARQGVGGWMRHSALTPTPWRLDEDTIRVFAGFRDLEGVSRIGYVDVLAEDPSTIVRVGAEPVLDIGRDGCFDDNGVILGDVVDAPGGLHMFYVGFQRVAKAKFLAFTGLAVSTDRGLSFSRMQETPILDRAPGRSTIAAVHTASYEHGRWRIWYAAGDDWEYIGGTPFPRYHIRHVATADLHAIPRADDTCIIPRGTEYRVGRPRVYRDDGRYAMYFTRGNLTGEYFPGVAESRDGITWERRDEAFGLALAADGWDSQVICYPSLLAHRDKLLMFYNGNDMGVDGFGVAVAARGGFEGGAHVHG
jgi:hypothetical protein